jgi:dGTPase
MDHPKALPASYQQRIEHDTRAHVICDYIAGMTDNYILDLHRKLRGKSVAQ